MPGKEQLAELQQKLEQLNRLEDEGSISRRRGRPALDSEPLLESLRASLPLSVLVQHDRLRARGRRSLAQVRQGVCSGCHMALPIGTLAEVKGESSLVRCNNCERFVFLAKVAQEDAPASAQRSKPLGRRSSRTK
jgi:predicted  nucleic acid-binding Zn-ribbon protein